MFVLQVQQSQEKIARLEQEKEHWLLEAQLGRVRLEKENQRIAELEARLSSCLGGGPAAPTHTEAGTEEPDELGTDEKMGGEASQSTSLVRHRSIRMKILFVKKKRAFFFNPSALGLNYLFFLLFFFF